MIGSGGLRIKERNRQEIEAKMQAMGDYVRMDYLRRALNSGLDFDSRKFVLVKLAQIYEERNMFADAGKLMKSAAEINTTFKAKMQDYMKSVQLFILGGNFSEADIVFAQAIASATERERAELKQSLRGYYMSQAKAYMSKDKRAQAKRTYEKILTLDLSQEERKNVQGELLKLYDRLGNVGEYYRLRNS